MKSAQSGPAKDDDHCYDTALSLSAAKLDVYRHERLAYTEAPIKSLAPPPLWGRALAALKAILRSCVRKTMFVFVVHKVRASDKRRP